ncbi:MAG: dimethylmenaquinone methyltransferase [Thermoleophilia bacterium]|nr:dimethylmenaquinone methyltransferase [Thermoleophilia bacterium]
MRGDRRFAELGVATIYEAAGRDGLVGGSLLRIIEGSRAAGPARTALCGANDNLAVHRLLATVEPEYLIVLTTAGQAGAALVGEILALQARVRGAAGILVDGPVRDADELLELGLPIWARSVCAAGAVKDEQGELDVPVDVGGVTIRPGDLVVLDGDGAVVVARARAEDVLGAAEARLRAELALMARLGAGEVTLDAMKLRGS